MQVNYLRICVPIQSVVQIKYFLQLGSVFCQNPKQKRKKPNRKKTKCGQTILQICNFFYVTMRILIAGTLLQMPGLCQFLGKIATDFTHFHLSNHLPHPHHSNEGFYIFQLPPFLLKLSSLLIHPPFSQSHLLLEK